jgi:HK97 family phage prohead protease
MGVVPVLQREWVFRDAAVKGRTLVLACVPFDTPTWVADGGDPYREEFAPGAFDHVDATRTQLRYRHSADLLDRLGSGLSLREDGGWLIGEFRVAGGARGDHLIDLVRDGELQGVSIGFDPGVDEQRSTPDGQVVRRVRVKRMPEVSLVDQPAYQDAGVLAVRADQARRAREVAALRALVRDMRPWAG